jgi:hypothetical protein
MNVMEANPAHNSPPPQLLAPKGTVHLHLKRQSHEIFELWVFHKETTSRHLINTINIFEFCFEFATL